MNKHIIIVIMMMALTGAVTAISSDPLIEVRGSSDFDANAPAANFLNQNPDPAEPGGYVEVRIKVENIGSETEDDISFEIVPEYPFSLDPGKSPVMRLGDADARQLGENAWVLYWKLRVDKDAIEGNNRIKLRYSVNSGATWINLDDYFVRIQTNDAIIQINDASTQPKIVEPGKEFTLTISIENIADSPLKDITGTLSLIYAQGATAVELPFTPLGSGNAKTERSMDAGSENSLTFKMIADTDAATGIYKVPFQLTYSDHLAKNYTVNNIIGIQVGTEPDLFVSIDRATPAEPGAEQEMTLRFVNKGKEGIRFLFVKIGDTGDLKVLSPSEAYIGNIDSDDFETESFMVIADKCDYAYKVPVTIEYESMSNEKFSEKKDLEFRTCNANQQNKGGSSGIIGLIIVLVIVVVAVWIYHRRKRKNQQ